MRKIKRFVCCLCFVMLKSWNKCQQILTIFETTRMVSFSQKEAMCYLKLYFNIDICYGIIVSIWLSTIIKTQLLIRYTGYLVQWVAIQNSMCKCVYNDTTEWYRVGKNNFCSISFIIFYLWNFFGYILHMACCNNLNILTSS